VTFRRSPNPKTACIQIRVTPDQKERIELKARNCMLSVSELALRQLLGKQVVERFELHYINHLNLLVEDFREIYWNENGREWERLQPLLDEIVVAVRALWQDGGRT